MFSVLHIKHAFFRIELKDERFTFTAFSTQYGKFKYGGQPNERSIVSEVFQEAIKKALKNLPRTFLFG